MAAASAPAPRGDWFSDLFGFAETSYTEAQRWLRAVPSKTAEGSCEIESLVNGARFNAGSFTTPSLAELRARGQEALKARSGMLKVSNEMGDVAKKHTQAENRFATFQVASQFNCLEFVGPHVAPEEGVTKYVCDRTQGPACSIACGPATVYRNYFAPVKAGGAQQVGQTRHRQIDNLADLSRVVGNFPTGKLFDVRGGYTLADASRLRKLDASLMKLTEEGKLDEVRAALRIGVHRDVQVTSWNWGSCRTEDDEQAVTQVFGSACAVAYSEGDSRSWRNFASIILEASYEATLWAALLNAHRHGGKHGSRRVFLTCLGGGVFGNSMSWIMQAMRRACELFKDCDLDIRVVTYAGAVDPELLAIEEDFATRAAKQHEKKRMLQAESKSESSKRHKNENGESTPSGKHSKEVVSPPKAECAKPSKASRLAKSTKEVVVTAQPKLDATVMKEAESLGYGGSLRNLAARPEVLSKKLPARVMLEALKRSDGLVNKAKNALLGV